MKRLASILLIALASLTAGAKNIQINTPNTTLLLSAEPGETVYFRYFGDKLDDANQVYHAQFGKNEAYPCFGYSKNFVNSFALSVTHFDGDLGTDLRYVSDTYNEKDGIHDWRITTKDSKYNFEVDLCYRTYSNCDVIEMWTVIRNGEKKPVTLEKFASAAMPFRQGDVWVSHIHGKWATEGYLTEEPLNKGVIEISDLACPKNAFLNRPNLMLSLDGKPQENSGRTVGAVLCWSGNFKMTVNTNFEKYHYLVCGINETASRYTLAKGESFTTPALAVVYSNEGKGGVSRN